MLIKTDPTNSCVYVLSDEYLCAKVLIRGCELSLALPKILSLKNSLVMKYEIEKYLNERIFYLYYHHINFKYFLRCTCNFLVHMEPIV